MLPIHLAPEPIEFDSEVRLRGHLAIARLVGWGEPYQASYQHPEHIPGGKFPPFWRSALPHLRTSYAGICSYMSVYIEEVTGAATVDHLIAKSQRWTRVYEWSNYRLACSLMNSRKSAKTSILDPTEIGDDWFRLELTGFQVIPGPRLTARDCARVEQTIEQLQLNSYECIRLRQSYVTDYFKQHISFDYLARRAPWVAAELRRQGRVPELT